MKIYLDLLPENRKRAMARKKRFKNIIKQEMLFLAPVILFVFILFSVNMILGIEKEGLDRTLAIAGSEGSHQDLKLYEEGFKDINEKVLDINNFQKNHSHWSDIIGILSGIVPNDVHLSELSTKDYQFFLVGKARTREVLMDFQDRMNKSECFENINVPLSNLVAKNDIDFQMDFNVKKECLIEKNK